MRACIQRVTRAKVSVGPDVTGSIEQGLLVLLGVGHDDSDQDAEYLAEKTVNLRIFEDSEGKMNRSLIDVAGGLLVVSQFTLWGDCRKGRRPSFVAAAEPQRAEQLYEKFVETARQRGLEVHCGRFRSMMQVELVNDGPVTLLLDSQKTF
ncbi:MAG: D-aminoacyl-tRNA deacylase [Pirellulaceae bacterium]|nr:D-aminoacyl-tRNA deacylase [Pirellulaceae bacterium]